MNEVLQDVGIVLIGIALMVHVFADWRLHSTFHRLHSEMLETIGAILRLNKREVDD